jgi:DNA-directed RNA polymerase
MTRGPLQREPCDHNWRKLYIAAIFETDKTKIASKITRAQIVIELHRRTVCRAANELKERRALDTALFSFQALATCMGNYTARDEQTPSSLGLLAGFASW